MRTHTQWMRATALFVASALGACNPPPAAGPAIEAPKPLVVAVAEPAPPPRLECPPGTILEGDQCAQVKAPEPPAPQPTAPPPEPAPPAPLAFALESGALKLPGPVVFATGSEKLRPESDPVLDFVKSYLLAKPEITLMRIEGHTSSEGSSAFNQALTEKRSLSVARWLIAHGIDCKRLIPVGFGDSKPIADNATAEGRQSNRRVRFVNAELKGKAVGGMPVDGGGKVAGDPCAATP